MARKKKRAVRKIARRKKPAKRTGKKTKRVLPVSSLHLIPQLKYPE